VTVQEIHVLFAIIIQMRHGRQDTLKDYWPCHEQLYTPFYTDNFFVYTRPSIYASFAYAISLICEREILPSARYMRENFAVMRFCAVEHRVAGRSCTCCWRDRTRGSSRGIQEEGSFSLAVSIQREPPFLEVNLDHLQQLNFNISDILT
jgi:hypothetical protein